MTELQLLNQAEALLKLHEWQYDGEEYRHPKGAQLMLDSHKQSHHQGILSPSSIRMVHGCGRRFYLARNPESQHTHYQSANGQTMKAPYLQNVKALEGRIIHETMRLLVNFILCNSMKEAKLGWRTSLTPLVHYAITKEITNTERSSSSPLVTTEIDLTVDGILDIINRITSEVLAKRLGGFVFEKKNWIELAKLDLRAELHLERDGFTGYADLVSVHEELLTIVDYKTGKAIGTDEKTQYSDQEACDVIRDCQHPLNSEAVQLACYAWMASTKERIAKTLIVRTSEIPLSIVELQIGNSSLHAISEVINNAITEAREILEKGTVPTGRYSSLVCGHCRFKMNCPELLKASTEADINAIAASQKKGTIPLLLKVVKISPESSTIELELARSTTSVKILGHSSHYLRQIDTVLRSGIDLLGFVKIFIGSDLPFSEVVEFSRC